MCRDKCDEESGSNMKAFVHSSYSTRILVSAQYASVKYFEELWNWNKTSKNQTSKLETSFGQLGGCDRIAESSFARRCRYDLKIKILCPPLSLFVENCYGHEIRLFVIGDVELKSTEGTTQRDLIVMALYGLSLFHLWCFPWHTRASQVKQVIYADDLTGAGRFDC